MAARGYQISLRELNNNLRVSVNTNEYQTFSFLLQKARFIM